MTIVKYKILEQQKITFYIPQAKKSTRFPQLQYKYTKTTKQQIMRQKLIYKQDIPSAIRLQNKKQRAIGIKADGHR